MAAVTSAIIGATVASAGLVNQIEQQNQATRRANQAKNGMQQDEENAVNAQNQANATAQAQKAANQARANQQNRVAGVGGGVSGGAAAGTLMGTPVASTPSQPGSNTLLGQ